MKLSKLLPIVAFSGIATVAAPLVTSCASGDSNVWKDFDCSTNEGVQYTSKKTKNLKSGTTYKASINLSEQKLTGQSNIQIMAGRGFATPDFKLYDFGSKDNAKLKIGQKDVALSYYEGVLTASWDDSYLNAKLDFSFDCISDLNKVTLIVWII